MSWIDWIIFTVPVLAIVGIAFYSRHYVRGIVDFLAAGRVAGRYVISVGDQISILSVITLVAACEANYQCGWGMTFWNYILAPVGILLGLMGYCSYRWRETRCLSKGQFIELRYGSRSFRFVTAFVSTTAEMVTNAIGPAIATKFFIYYMGLPHRVMICGVSLPCYGIIVVLCLVLAILLIWPGGRVSLLLTDSVQSLLSYPIYVIFAGFIILKFSWNVDILPILSDRVPNQSFLNPYDLKELRDFNVFALIVNVVGAFLSKPAWYGNDVTNSGRTPHEQKMAGVLGAWRNGFALVLTPLLAMMTYCFMNSGNFSSHDPAANHFSVTNNEVRQELSARVLDELVTDKVRLAEINDAVQALPDVKHVPGVSEPLSQERNLDTRYLETVKNALGDTPEDRYIYQQYRSVFQQMMMPTVMSKILPAGLVGIFGLLMIMLLISTDDTRIFNAVGCIVQDMILPFIHRKLEPKKHIALLRWTSVAVAVFFFIVSMFFSQLDYINMFVTIMCSFWLGSAGPIMVGGLYTRFGNLTGAWSAVVFGSGTSLVGLMLQRTWAKWVYPWLDAHNLVDALDGILRFCSHPFEPYIVWRMDPVKFPINSNEIYFISMMLGIIAYVVGSYLTYKPYDLDKLLHRGKYADEESAKFVPAKQRWTPLGIIRTLVGITSEYTLGDKIIAWSVFIYSFGYQLGACFLMVLVWNCLQPWPPEAWGRYFFYVILVIPACIGCVSTVWFLWGGCRDIMRLFKDLEKRKNDPDDNGQLID